MPHVVHLWGPVMVMPFAEPRRGAPGTVEVLSQRRGGTAGTRAVVVDLAGRTIMDDGFGAAALEQVIEVDRVLGCRTDPHRGLTALGGRRRRRRAEPPADAQGPARGDRVGLPDGRGVAASQLTITVDGFKSPSGPSESDGVGSLQQTPLPLLLLGLHRDGFTGPLTLRQGDRSKCVRWQQGNPVGLTSSLAGEDLVSTLVRAGQLSDEEAAAVLACMQERGWDELRSVAALGKVPPRELVGGLANQIHHALVECFGWDDGEFQMDFEAQAEAAPALPVDVVQLVHAGIARHWPFERVMAALGERSTKTPTPGDGFAEARARLPQSDALDAFLSQFDGTNTAFSLVQQDPQPAFWAALWVFDALATLDWDAETEAAEPEPEPDLGPEIEIVVAGDSSGASADPRADSRSDAGAEAGDDRAAALRDEIVELHGRLAEMTHYELLGLEPGCNPGQVKRAYLKAAKRLHPDRLSNLGVDDVKQEANDLFAQITRAHKVLSDVDERRSYDASLEGHTEVDADRVAQAEVFFRKGEALLHAGNFLDAVELLESAVSIWPEEADYQAALAWCLHRKNPPSNERAIEHFEKALELGGERAQTLLRMSFPLKEMGETERAAELAAKARRLDPQVKP